MVALSEWEEEPGPGFVIIEEDKNNPKDDDSWGAKENGIFDNGDDFFRDRDFHIDESHFRTEKPRARRLALGLIYLETNCKSRWHSGELTVNGGWA